MSKDKEMPEKADLQSLDISAENRAKLKQLFPAAFTETKDEKGKLVESVDFEKLKAELGTFSDVFESRRERYGMDWPGKKECMKLIQKSSIATLKPCREESVSFDDTENLFIEGDNLEVLKLLQKSYYGKIKMIYIDPPFNTGKEFIYPDDFTESLDTYLSYAGILKDDNKYTDSFAVNSKDRPHYHTKWLNMMYPRLYLARNLLRNDGVIFISIDDNESCNLKKMCNEVFGEENYVADIVWQNRVSPANDAKWFSGDHEYMVVYARQKDVWHPNRTQRTSEHDKYYKNPDNDPRGPWNSAAYTCNKSRSERPNLYYPIINPNTNKEIWPDENAVWAYSKEKHAENVSNNLLYWGQDGKSKSPRRKQFLTDAKPVVPRSVWTYKDVGSTQQATSEIRELFNGAAFSYPKSKTLIKKAIYHATNSDDIILDFFAGSATTAHAVIEMNSEDNGSRKFIMVQLPERCDEHSESFKAGYKDISDIGKERIRRAIKKIEKEQAVKSKKASGDLLGSLQEPIMLDLGFKVLKLDKSNFDVWDGSEPEPTDEKIAKQLEAFIEHIDPKATQEDILFELLLKAGFKPIEKIEKKEFAGKTVFSIAEGLLLICLEDEITKELIEAVAEAEPLQFICLDRGFKGNDQLKANAVQTFAARNQGRDRQEQIVFRTV